MPKNRIFIIKVWLLRVSDEELASIRVWPTVRHRYDSSLIVSQFLNKLILEVLPVYALPCLSSSCWVSSLHDKVLDVPVKYRLIIVALGAECQKVFAGDRCQLTKKLNLDFTQIRFNRHRHNLNPFNVDSALPIFQLLFVQLQLLNIYKKIFFFLKYFPE